MLRTKTKTRFEEDFHSMRISRLLLFRFTTKYLEYLLFYEVEAENYCFIEVIYTKRNGSILEV